MSTSQPTDNSAPQEAITAYYDSFVAEYGLTPEKNKIVVLKMEDEEWRTETDVFSCDGQTGDIKILYANLYGGVYTYDDGSKNNPYKWLYRRRLREPRGDMKYAQPKGSRMNPFFTRGLIEKYQAKTPISTLYFVEGEKKALKGWLAGLDIVGLPSINGYVREAGERRLHEDIEELIKVCQVKTVVFITDADTLMVKWEDGKELSTRPNHFYEAVNKFRQGCDALILQPDSSLKRVYYVHLKTELVKTAKGLDDLLINYADKTAEILKDLAEHHTAHTYFFGWDLTDGNLSKLRSYFGLNEPEQFYKVYGEMIGYREFIWKGRCYQHSGEKVMYVRHQDASQYMRIGDQFMKVVKIPNKFDELEPHLRKWKVGEIVRDYKKFPYFFDEIPKYEAFCNVPSNNGVYKRVHHNCYNMYEPLKYDITKWEGDYKSIQHTLGFLKHLFRGEATAENDIMGDPFTVMLDYLTILFKHPKQILPVPCLVSPENNTGKSTFLKWLKDIYGANATILGNEQFKQSFNSHYINKFIIGIDEGFIDVEKKADKERLKKLATDEKQYLEYKGMDVQEIDYYGKIIICSNDADRLMKIETGEIRWYVVRVPQLKEGEEKPNLREDMRKEISAWLGYLYARTICHPNESRAWFSPKYLVTDQLKRIIETTRSWHERVVETYIRETFELFGLSEFKMHKEHLLTEINKTTKYKLDGEQLTDYLKNKKGLTPKLDNIKIPRIVLDNGAIEYYDKQRQRAYSFRVQDWFEAAEQAALGIASDPLTTSSEPETTLPTGGEFGKVLPKNELPF